MHSFFQERCFHFAAPDQNCELQTLRRDGNGTDCWRRMGLGQDQHRAMLKTGGGTALTKQLSPSQTPHQDPPCSHMKGIPLTAARTPRTNVEHWSTCGTCQQHSCMGFVGCVELSSSVDEAVFL